MSSKSNHNRQISRSKPNFVGTGIEIASFLERFKGKIQLMDKEGHIGVVKKSQLPIEKEQNPPPTTNTDSKGD